jgi:uncharacterized protein (DUF58 family)
MTGAEPQTKASSLLSPDFLRRLERLDFVTKKIMRGELRGERRSRRRGPGVEFSDHRAYVPGDDWRHIDWNVYSRLRELHVKQFLVEENLNIALFVDCSPSMDYGLVNKLAAAVRVAAALGYVGLGHFDRLAFYASGRPPGSRRGLFLGKGARLPFLEEAASVGTTEVVETLDRFASDMVSLFRGPSLAVVISDFYDASAMVGPLGFLAGRRHDVVALQMVDPHEEDPPFSGPARLVDAETGGTRVFHVTPALRQAYRLRFASHLSRVERLFASRRIRLARIPTDRAFDGAVLELLRRGFIYKHFA